MLGWQEVVLIFAILLFVFGPKELPKIARELGKAMREFNKATSDLTEEFIETSSGLTKTVRPSSTGASRSLPKVTEEFIETSSGFTKTVRPSSTGVSRPPPKVTDTWKRDKALLRIAKKLNIAAEGKTNEQMTKEIIEKIDSKKHKASNAKTIKR